MSKITSGICGALTLCFILFQSALSPATLSNSLLWKIEGPEPHQTSYLFGTIHAICPDDFYLTEAIKEKLASSQRLVMEINLEEVNLSAVQSSMMTMDDNKRLEDVLGAGPYKKLKDYLLSNSGIDISYYNRLKPIFLSSIMLPVLLGCPPQSVENLLLQEAKAKNIKVAGLETLSHQLQILSEVPLDVQVQFLQDTMNDLPLAKSELRELIRLYNQELIDQLYELIRESDFQKYEYALLTNRNENWIPKMKTAMDSSSVFFAVGAGHLGGERGVIRLLQKEGYTLSPIQLN